LAQLAALCPDAQREEHDPNADLEELLSLTEQLQSFSPMVGMEQLDPWVWAGRSLKQPQAIGMGIEGTAGWFGGEHAMAIGLHQWLAHRGYMACIGVADTWGAAWGVANYSFRPRIADAMEGMESNGIGLEPQRWISVIPPGEDLRVCFADYPIECLRLPTDCVAKLHRLGIRSMAPLLRLPRSALPSRFGDSLLKRIDQFLGDIEEPLRVFHPVGDFLFEREWEHPISDLTSLEESVAQACGELCRKLADRGCGALRVACRLALESPVIHLGTDSPSPCHGAHVIQISLFQASHDPFHLSWLFQGQLQQSPPRLGAGMSIRALRLEATLTAPLTWHQNELFGNENPQHRKEIAKLVDSLSARLGRNRVVATSILRDPLPEDQVRTRPLTGLRSDGIPQETDRKLSRAPKRNFASEGSLDMPAGSVWSRPCELIAPMSVGIDCHSWGEPTSISIERNRWKVVACAGPERIESGWWAGPMQRREYYRIALESGDWWWVFRDMKTDLWYLHGAFS
jgi:protein ImuB